MTKQFDHEEFDLIEDLLFFINNDPEFYRSHYFPVASKFIDTVKVDKTATPDHFKNVVDQAYGVYRDRFQLDHLPNVLTPDQVDELCNKLHNQELHHFHNKDEVNEEISILKQLAGISSSSAVQEEKRVDKSKIMKENNILPGSNEWFKLWFETNGLNMTPTFRGRKK